MDNLFARLRAEISRRFPMIGEPINDGAIAAVASKAAMGGGTAAWVGWLASSEFVAISGFSIGIVGLCVQFYYKRREDRRNAEKDRRDAEFHALRMSELVRK